MNLSPVLFAAASLFLFAADRPTETFCFFFTHISAFFLFVFPLPPSPSSLQEEDFQEMVSTAQTMETQYGHLFDKVIVNDDLSTAFGELRLALKSVETESHWVPVSWAHS